MRLDQTYICIEFKTEYINSFNTFNTLEIPSPFLVPAPGLGRMHFTSSRPVIELLW